MKMDSVLERTDRHPNLTEVYEVVGTSEVVREGKNRFRLDIIKS